MAHSKTIQFFRNNTVIRPTILNQMNVVPALTAAKNALDTYGSKIDGEITLVRYQEGNNDPVKTLLGIYHDDGNNTGTWTFINEPDFSDYYTKEEIEETEEVIAQALSDLDERIQSNSSAIPTALSQLTDDSTHRLVTDANKSTWNAKADPITITTIASTGDVSQALAPDTFYKFGTIDSLTITLAGGAGALYAGKFTTSSTWDAGTKLSIPSGITEATNNDATESGKTYEFNIFDTIIVVREVA